MDSHCDPNTANLCEWVCWKAPDLQHRFVYDFILPEQRLGKFMDSKEVARDFFMFHIFELPCVSRRCDCFMLFDTEFLNTPCHTYNPEPHD